MCLLYKLTAYIVTGSCVFESLAGRLPLGYLREAEEIARRSHCVPLPPMADAESYDIITARLLSFLQVTTP